MLHNLRRWGREERRTLKIVENVVPRIYADVVILREQTPVLTLAAPPPEQNPLT